jgi:hypothetical protein
MKTSLRLLFAVVANTTVLVLGFLVYLVTKRTPAFGYHGMVRLFCLTGGHSNDHLSVLIGFAKPVRDIPDAAGVLGDMSSPAKRELAVRALREDGYHIFDRRLDGGVCDRLLTFATSHPCELRPMDGGGLLSMAEGTYRRVDPQAVRYDFRTEDLLRCPDVQKVIADLSLAAVAQDYLGARPVIDALSMWWLTDFSKAPDSQAAQYFHFDMDRPKWLKFFIYLTDVSSMNGPHTFVAGSHRSGAIPRDLLKKGYSRLADGEVERYFATTSLKEMVAPRGTILAEDTRGLHKGKHVICGDRLLLQIQYSNSLFGAYYPKERMRGSITGELKISMKKFPFLYSTYR